MNELRFNSMRLDLMFMRWNVKYKAKAQVNAYNLYVLPIREWHGDEKCFHSRTALNKKISISVPLSYKNFRSRPATVIKFLTPLR